MPDNQVRPIRKRTKAEVSGAIAAGWARVSAGRKGAFADNLDVDVKTVNRALTGDNVPELHTAWNSLADDPTALSELAALYRVMIVPMDSKAAGDLELAAGLGHSVAELLDRLKDGHRCHLDTLALGELFRRIVPQMQSIISEADEIRGVGA